MEPARDPEISAISQRADGLVIVVGCSHPGIAKIVEVVGAINPRIHLIVGGLHLVVASGSDIEKIVTTLRDRFKVDCGAPAIAPASPRLGANKGLR